MSAIYATRYHQELEGDGGLASCGSGWKRKYVLKVYDSGSFPIKGQES
jgi:hypothetical protein